MAEVEWEHEAFFRSCVLRHWLGKRLTIWPMPLPKINIRESFEKEGLVTDQLFTVLREDAAQWDEVSTTSR
jgi:hypothetical protein